MSECFNLFLASLYIPSPFSITLDIGHLSTTCQETKDGSMMNLYPIDITHYGLVTLVHGFP